MLPNIVFQNRGWYGLFLSHVILVLCLYLSGHTCRLLSINTLSGRTGGYPDDNLIQFEKKGYMLH